MTGKSDKLSKRFSIGLFLTLAILISLIGLFSYFALAENARQRTADQLHSITSLKVGQIEAWLADRMNDARLQAVRPPHFRRLSNSSRYDLAEEVQRSHLVMMEAQKIYGYTNIELFDAVGQRVDQVGFESISVEGLTSERVSHLLGTTEPQLIDIFKTGNPEFPFSLAFAVAIHDPETTGAPGVGFVVLHVDPEKYLYPLIQSWPVPSKTAESLLIRRDGEDVLFLNELRHTKSPPLTIRISLANTEVPAVQAVLNVQTEVSGTDYRNVPVFSDTQVIRNSPWFIVAKVDQSEVLAGLRSMSLLVLGLVLLVVAITGLFLLLNYRQRQRNQEQEFTEELGKREQRFKDFSESSADWFWETDAEHRFAFLSSNATQMLGGRQVEELIGHSRMELAKEDGLYLFNLWEAHAAVLAQRIPFRHFEYSLLDGDGQHAWLSVSGVPFVDMVGEFAGYRGVGQVVTARHKAEDELARHRQSLELLVEHRTAELATTESQMRGIIDASGDGIIKVDRVGNVLLANPAACKILGYPAEELLGCKLHEKIHHSHQDGRHYLAEHCPTAQAIASGGTLHGMEDVFWHADGSPVFVSISVQTINSGDEIVGGVVNFTDISKRKDAEKIIKESDAFKTAILDAMPAHIAVLDRNGIIVTVNAPWIHFSDVNRLDRGILSGDSQIGTNYLDICLRCVGDSVDDAQEAHDGIKTVLEGRSASFNLQYRCHSAQEDHWYSMSVSPLGMPLQGVVISHTNITDQKLAEARRTLLEYALDQVDEGAYLMNQFGSFDYVNEGAARQLGYTREELLNMDVWEIDRDLPKSEWPALWAKIRKNKTVTLETQHWKKDGSVMPVDINANHLLFENHDYSLALARDITKHKEMQEQQKAAMKAAENLARVKSEFLANMSHEIRTPLNGVLGMAQIGYRESIGRGRSQEIFSRILSSGKLLLGIINDILDFSKIEAGKLALESVPVDPGYTINAALETLIERSWEKKVEMKVDLAPDLPVAFLCDATRLSQILLNLLSNAVKFTEQGEVCVCAYLDKAEIVFSVSDTGIGMTDAQLVRLFQPFEQADASTTRKYGGTGLGLTISLSLAEMMGGSIRASSSEGIGSVFELRLPCTPTEISLDATYNLMNDGALGQRLRDVRILAAEDNEINQLVLCDLLAQEGALVKLVGNGQLAVEALKNADYDIVLMDVQMPIMDGLEATRRIRESHVDLPIIGQTAHALSEEHARCRASGMNDVITKPLDSDMLVAAIKRSLGHASVEVSVEKSNPETMQRPVSETALDWVMLEHQFPLKPGFVTKICNTFLASYTNGPARIREAAANNPAQLAQLAHSLKGVAGSLMAHKVVEHAKTIELTLQSGQADIAQIAEEFALSLQAMLDEIKNRLEQ